MWGGRQSLVSFSKDVILFALHVLKVKSRACHALVDVFDVIAGRLKVCGGIIGAGTEHLETSRAPGQGESGRGPGWAARSQGQERPLTWLSEPSSMGSYKSLMATNLRGRQAEGKTSQQALLDLVSTPPPAPWLPPLPQPQPQPFSPSLLVNGLQQLQGRLNLLFRLRRLHCGAGDSDVLALCSHVVRIRDHAHVDVCPRESAPLTRAQRVPGSSAQFWPTCPALPSPAEQAAPKPTLTECSPS